MDEARFKTAMIITTKDLGDGAFRHMAVVDRRVVDILQSPKPAIDELMNTEAPAEPVTVTNGRDRIAASLSGKAIKPAVIKLTGRAKIAAGLTAQAAKKGSQ